MNRLTPNRTTLAFGALVAGLTIAGSAAFSQPAITPAIATAADANVALERVDHRRWRGGGIGIIIEPGYGYGYDDYPRYRSYNYGSYYGDDYDYRPRRHSRKWVRERFEHPLGRR